MLGMYRSNDDSSILNQAITKTKYSAEIHILDPFAESDGLMEKEKNIREDKSTRLVIYIINK